MGRILILVSIFLFLVTACGIDVKPFDSPVVLPKRFSTSGEAMLLDRWWLSFNDTQLNQMIDTALMENQDLRATFRRLEQAQAIAKKAGAELIPALNGNSSLDHSVFNQGITEQSNIDSFTIGLAASYELDLWGRIRANKRAAELDSQIAELDIHTAAIALSAQIASTWYQLIEQCRQLELLNRQIETNKQYVNLVMARYTGGQGSAADVFQQQQVLEAVQGDKYLVLAAIDVLKNQLAVLTGRAPGLFEVPAASNFPQLADLPNTGLTADLIQRRPDIQQKFLSIQASDLRVSAAIADRFPKLSLSTGINTSAPNLQDFFNNWLATLAGNLVLPIIDGGRRVAEVARNQAVTAENLDLYGQKLLTALQEVENALAQEAQQHKRVNSLQKQLRYLADANQQIRMRYGYGGIDFLRVLTSLINLQSLERSMIKAERELIEYRINLYRSLAGGWELKKSEIKRKTTHG